MCAQQTMTRKSTTLQMPEPDAAYEEKVAKARRSYLDNRTRFTAMRIELDRVRGASSDRAVRKRHISRQFVFTAVDGDNLCEGVYRPQLVEPLLQQAAMFVNRVLAEEPVYRQMLVDQKNLALDVEEFVALDEINGDEVEAGLFKLPYWEAAGDSRPTTDSGPRRPISLIGSTRRRPLKKATRHGLLRTPSSLSRRAGRPNSQSIP